MIYIELILIAFVFAIVPIITYYRKNKTANHDKKISNLLFLISFLVFDLILFGSFTRLTDSGLGCPDWPGCFASSNPFSASYHIQKAQLIDPNGAVTNIKAWIEMLHRYFASAVGVLIIFLNILVYKYRSKVTKAKFRKNILISFGLLTLVIIQGLFGKYTVTLKLQPIIVSLHLILALSLLFLLILAYLYNYTNSSINNSINNINLNTKYIVIFAAIFLCIQIALGAWVSTNYAILGCYEFPTCIKGQYLPQLYIKDWIDAFSLWRDLGKKTDGQVLNYNSLTAIHLAHRYTAIVVVLTNISLAFILWYKNAADNKLRYTALLLLAVILIQACTGIANVLMSYVLPTALLHTAGAAILVVIYSYLIYIMFISKSKI
jgi:heme a synthase